MSLERGTSLSPVLWLSFEYGTTPVWGSRRETREGFRAPGEAATGGTEQVPPPPIVVPVSEHWRVLLPPSVQEPFEVYVNGVPQRRGADYEVRGRELEFGKALAKEGRLGAIRWLSIFLGVAGTYRKNDSVDVVYEVGGRRMVASSLPILPPERPS
jgi:predicted RNA-binding protein YlqC (UPF0109 family)